MHTLSIRMCMSKYYFFVNVLSPVQRFIVDEYVLVVVNDAKDMETHNLVQNMCAVEGAVHVQGPDTVNESPVHGIL